MFPYCHINFRDSLSKCLLEQHRHTAEIYTEANVKAHLGTALHGTAHHYFAKTQNYAKRDIQEDKCLCFFK